MLVIFVVVQKAKLKRHFRLLHKRVYKINFKKKKGKENLLKNSHWNGYMMNSVDLHFQYLHLQQSK